MLRMRRNGIKRRQRSQLVHVGVQAWHSRGDGGLFQFLRIAPELRASNGYGVATVPVSAIDCVAGFRFKWLSVKVRVPETFPV